MSKIAKEDVFLLLSVVVFMFAVWALASMGPYNTTCEQPEDTTVEDTLVEDLIMYDVMTDSIDPRP